MIWVAIGLLTLVACLFALYPLLKGTAEDAGPRRLDIFERQLREIDRDEADGVIAGEEARAARLEVKRRILAADRDRDEEKIRVTARGRRMLVSGALAAMLAGLFLYSEIGRPGLGGDPYEAPGLQAQADGDGEGRDLNALVDRLMAHLADNPEDLEGWRHFRRAALSLDRQADMARALLSATRARPDNAALAMLYAESLIVLGNGQVTPAAELALDRVAALSPDEPALYFYRARGLTQQGEIAAARDVWAELLARTPAGAPWAASVEREIARADRMLGRSSSESGPESEAGAAIANLPEDDRQAAIRGMVEGLAARLADEPDNLDGWQRLARAWQVLGETEKARNAWAHVRDLARKSGDDATFKAAEAALQAL